MTGLSGYLKVLELSPKDCVTSAASPLSPRCTEELETDRTRCLHEAAGGGRGWEGPLSDFSLRLDLPSQHSCFSRDLTPRHLIGQ